MYVSTVLWLGIIQLMKSNVATLLAFMVGFGVFAQTDLNKQPVTIGGLNTVEQEGSNTSAQSSGLTLKIPSVVNNNTVSPTPEENKSLITTEDFLDPGEHYQKKLNKKIIPNSPENNSEAYAGNIYFGDFKSSAKAIKVYCRDFGVADGDRVRILVNEVEIHPNVLLNNNYKVFTLELAPGFNKIDFYALNQGEQGPNTAELRVFDIDGKEIMGDYWNLKTDSYASVIIVKE